MSRKSIFLICAFLLLGAATEASAGLVLHYKFDETSGTTAFDSSGYGFDVDVTGTAAWDTSGRIDGSLGFNGSSIYIDVPAGAFSDIREQISFGM